MHGIFSNWETLLARKYMLAKAKPYRKLLVYRGRGRDAIRHAEEPSQFQDMNQNEVRVLRVSETRLYFFFLFLEEKELCEISGLV